MATVSLTAAGQESTQYPIEIADFQKWQKFPAECAGYRRSTVRAYAPEFSNYSVTYHSFGSTLKNAVTLFFYPRPSDSSAQLQKEVSAVLNAYEDAYLVSRRQIKLEAKGKTYDAAVITFEFSDTVDGSRQPLSSQLLLVFLEKGTFKVRSTSLAEQADAAEAAVLELLQCVAWST
ncbi:hypothetical protein ASE26_14440 [Duganella sp. Root198D2]|nr:hypothetical protein ASE26_14440 [Duganella sp. Root198D2]